VILIFVCFYSEISLYFEDLLTNRLDVGKTRRISLSIGFEDTLLGVALGLDWKCSGNRFFLICYN